MRKASLKLLQKLVRYIDFIVFPFDLCIFHVSEAPNFAHRNILMLNMLTVAKTSMVVPHTLSLHILSTLIFQ